MPSSECSAAIEEDEYNGWTSKSDEGEGSEVGNQVEIEAHGKCVRSNEKCDTSYGAFGPSRPLFHFDCDGLSQPQP